MTWVKICGITNVDDARAAVDAGANALGFVFYPESPRRVTADMAQSIIAEVPQNVDKVGVFVNETVNTVSEIVKHTGLTAVQLHGDENKLFSLSLFKALAIESRRPTIFRSCPCLLYTSPSPRDRTRSRMPSSA